MNARLCRCEPLPGRCRGPANCPMCAEEVDVRVPDDAECVKAILDDYLLIGYSYPKRGGTLTAGEILMAVLSKAQVESALTAQVFGCGDQASDAQAMLEKALQEHALTYIERLHYGLIVRMREEIMEYEAEKEALDALKQHEGSFA